MQLHINTSRTGPRRERAAVTDNELQEIIDKMARKLLERRPGRIELDIVGANAPHGIYMYDKKRGKWLLIKRSGGHYTPEKTGIHVIYFDNASCPACRVYDITWYTYIEMIGRKLDKTYFIIILCDWFAERCGSEAAKKSFQHYNIHASPTTLLLYIENGETIYSEKIEGARTLDYLALKIDEFMRKARKIPYRR